MCPKQFLSLWYVWRKPCTYLTERDSTCPTSPRSSIWCIQNDFPSLWYVWHQPCTHLVSRLASSPNARNELRLDPLHLGVPSGASKTISDPMVHLVQTVHLSCTDTNTISKERSEIPHDPHHLGVPSGAAKMISEPIVRSTQTVHLSFIKIGTISERTETSFH